jgi:hypothetical protein
VAEQLAQLAREFKTNDPAQAAELRREYKTISKNDAVRIILYLMEVVGARDAQFKNLQEENGDLKELLKLNNIDVEKLADESEETKGIAPGGDTAPVAAEGNTTAAASGQSGPTNSEAASGQAQA